MEITKYKDFEEWADTQKQVWFVGKPAIIRCGDGRITDSYVLEFPIQSGYLHNIGYSRGQHPYESTYKFTTLPYCFSEKDYFTFNFDVKEDDTTTLKGKIFTKEKEAERYWEKTRKPYLKEMEEKNKKYGIALSDIAKAFNIPENEMHSIVINQYK